MNTDSPLYFLFALKLFLAKTKLNHWGQLGIKAFIDISNEVIMKIWLTLKQRKGNVKRFSCSEVHCSVCVFYFILDSLEKWDRATLVLQRRKNNSIKLCLLLFFLPFIQLDIRALLTTIHTPSPSPSPSPELFICLKMLELDWDLVSTSRSQPETFHELTNNWLVT